MAVLLVLAIIAAIIILCIIGYAKIILIIFGTPIALIIACCIIGGIGFIYESLYDSIKTKKEIKEFKNPELYHEADNLVGRINKVYFDIHDLDMHFHDSTANLLITVKNIRDLCTKEVFTRELHDIIEKKLMYASRATDTLEKIKLYSDLGNEQTKNEELNGLDWLINEKINK